MWNLMKKWRAQRKVLRELNGLNRRELKDLGITAGDMTNLARGI